MYKLGTVICLFVVMLVWACGCTSVPASGTAQAGPSVATPTLPAMYVAGETTLTAGSATITSTPIPANATAANIVGAQVNTTLTEVTIACTGQTCTSGTTNSTISGSSTTTVSAPVSAIAANVTMAYVKQNPDVAIQFTDSSSNTPPYSWMWSWRPAANLTYESDPSIVLVFNQYGNYMVTRSVSNSVGTSSSSTNVSVCPLVASFTTNQTTGPVPLSVRFTDTSTDQPVSWLWNFGDGSASTLQNPVHTYTTAGVYLVNLSASNGYDGMMSAQPVKITIWSLPTASFTASPVTGMPGTSVLFSDQSTGFPSPAFWYWDFGDGYTSSQQNPSHQYVNAGTYNVSHSATNAQGITWLNKTAYITIS